MNEIISQARQCEDSLNHDSASKQKRKRREAAGKPTERPNLVFGGDVHVVWEKFCRYFDVEPRIVPLQPDKYTIGPEDGRRPPARSACSSRGRGGA